MKISRFTDSQIMRILKQAESGISAPELCRVSCKRTNERLRYSGKSSVKGISPSNL